MSTDQPRPGPEDDPFAKRPGDAGGSEPPGGTGEGSPYDRQPPRSPPPSSGGGPSDGAPYGGGPYGPGPGGPGIPDPLAGMPPLADSGKRLLARVIDILIVAIPLWLLSLVWGGVDIDVAPEEMDTGRSLVQSAVGAVAYIGYDTLMIRGSGQTLGKRLMGIRVASLADGGIPDARSSLIRAVVLWLPALFCCLCVWTVITGGWVLFDKPYKQGLHDKVARTVVVAA